MYEALGFKDNIFNTASLDLKSADLPKFVGRVRELKQFVIDVSASRDANIIVTGDKGVGKTSFVNIVQYAAGFKPDFLKQHIKVGVPKLIPCYCKIQLSEHDAPESILLKSLSGLLFSIQQYANELQIDLPAPLKKYIQWMSEVVVVSHTASVHIAGIGGGVGKTSQHKHIPSQSPVALQQILNEVISLAQQHFKVEGVFLNINNLELLTEQKVCSIFNELRDYLFNMQGLWLVIVGQIGLYSLLYEQAPGVAEVISGRENRLDPLSEEDLIKVLNQRCKVYAKSNKNVPSLPIDDGLVREIYKNSDGEIRQVLKSCDDIMQYAFQMNPNMKFIKSSVGRDMLCSILTQQLAFDRMKAKELEMIRLILKKGSLRPKDFETLKLKSPVDFTNKATPLLARNFLKKEVEGNMANYKVAGRVLLAAYAGVKVKDEDLQLD